MKRPGALVRSFVPITSLLSQVASHKPPATRHKPRGDETLAQPLLGLVGNPPLPPLPCSPFPPPPTPLSPFPLSPLPPLSPSTAPPITLPCPPYRPPLAPLSPSTAPPLSPSAAPSSRLGLGKARPRESTRTRRRLGTGAGVGRGHRETIPLQQLYASTLVGGHKMHCTVQCCAGGVLHVEWPAIGASMDKE